MRKDKMVPERRLVTLNDAPFEKAVNDGSALMRPFCDGLVVIAGNSTLPSLFVEYGAMREAALAMAIMENPALKQLIGRAMVIVERAEYIDAKEREATEVTQDVVEAVDEITSGASGYNEGDRSQNP